MDEYCRTFDDASDPGKNKRLETQTHLTAILNTAHDAIIAVDSEQRIQLFNTAAQRMFGYSADEIIDQPIDILIPPRARSGHREQLDNFNSTAGTKPQSMGDWRQIRGLRSDGSEFPMLASIAKTAATDCEPLTIVTIRDKTYEIEVERALRQSIEKELKMNEQHLNFAANITHELRTPLNAIIGFSELLIAHPDMFEDEKTLDYLKIIHQAGENLNNKMTQFMDFSEAESGDKEYFRESVNLASICASIIKSLELEAREKKVELVLKDIVGIPEITSDANAARTILFNIISNAIKYNVRNGQVEIQLIVSQDNVLVTVIDTGVGIPPEQQMYLGRPFFRGQNAYNSKMSGVGLGLALATSIARGIGARINIQSNWGSGTSVRINFPKDAVQDQRRNLI